jgi:hypothetical protein
MKHAGKSLLSVAMALALGAAVADEALDYQQMRAYVVSRLTDAQIREARRLAALDHAKNIEAAKKAEIESLERDRQRYEKCGDIAYKTRNPGACTPGIRAEAQIQSVEILFEQRLMGLCLYANTVAKAKEYGCLPTK